MRRVVHLIDDTSAGGVTRLLDFIRASSEMGALAEHDVVETGAGFSKPPTVRADVIVSHVVLSWRNLPFFVALRARYPRTPLVHMEHHYSPAFVRDEVTRETRFASMLRVSMSLFDRVVTISTAQRDWLAQSIGVSETKLALIPPCVDISAFLAIPLPVGPIRRIGALGRLHPQKGFDILIPAFRAAKLEDVELHLFGDGSEEARLRDLAAEDPRIVFHGHVADPAAAMASVDAVAMPSRREPYGLVALEALAAGRPLLVSRADGLRDHAANGAIAVDQLTSGAWAAALQSLSAATDPSQRSATARSRAAGAERRFVEGWAALLSDLCGHVDPHANQREARSRRWIPRSRSAGQRR